jgi:hypothetical protein
MNGFVEDDTAVPTANLKRLTASANRLILAADERSLQVDLVRSIVWLLEYWTH